MEVEVKLYGMLRQYRPPAAAGLPHRSFPLEVGAPATAEAVIAALGMPQELVTGCAVNGEAVELMQLLAAGDSISLFPPTAGGTAGLPVRIFLAGVMQANREDHLIEDQHYRLRLAALLREELAVVEILDPWALNPNSVAYDDARARHTFLTMTRKAAEVDLLIAYLPQPSMGTAMEMWQAHEAGVAILAITPFVHHWAVRHTAREILPDLASFEDYVRDGRLRVLLRARGAGFGKSGHGD